jgi:hypothetical protein
MEERRKKRKIRMEKSKEKGKVRGMKERRTN